MGSLDLGDFHAGDRGSNPLGEAKEDTDMTGKSECSDFPVFVYLLIQCPKRPQREMKRDVFSPASAN
jgi:hypothetical protein